MNLTKHLHLSEPSAHIVYTARPAGGEQTLGEPQLSLPPDTCVLCKILPLSVEGTCLMFLTKDIW